MRNTLICTVGTSLFNNLSRSEESLQKPFKDKNWNQLALELVKLPNTDRVCGAEINSITSICEKNLISEKINLFFLVSDTEDGKCYLFYKCP